MGETYCEFREQSRDLPKVLFDEKMGIMRFTNAAIFANYRNEDQ